jgi:hypothetical protein
MNIGRDAAARASPTGTARLEREEREDGVGGAMVVVMAAPVCIG